MATDEAEAYVRAFRMVLRIQRRLANRVTVWCRGQTTPGDEPWLGFELPAELFARITPDNAAALEKMLSEFRDRMLALLEEHR